MLLQRPLQLRLQCRLRRRAAVGNAVRSDPHQRGSLVGSLIGEEVSSLRYQCTGQWPVHFFRMAGVVAALVLASVATTASAAPDSRLAVPAVQQPPVTGQSIADFYR